MAGDPPSQHSDKDPDVTPTGSDLGWTALSYLIGGMAVWGFIGWLVVVLSMAALTLIVALGLLGLLTALLGQGLALVSGLLGNG